MPRRHTAFSFLAALGGCLVAVVPAVGADLGTSPQYQPPDTFPPGNGWQFSFTPYGWMTSINGNVTARGHTVDVDENFFEIVEKSNSLMALMGYFEARKGPISFFTDAVWEDLGFPGHLTYDIKRNVS